MNIYVGNLSRDVTDDVLRKAFEKYGIVESAKVITDKFTSESRGFGFVEMPSKDEAKEAMTSLDGSELNGKNISVNEARPKTDRHRGGGGGGHPAKTSATVYAWTPRSASTPSSAFSVNKRWRTVGRYERIAAPAANVCSLSAQARAVCQPLTISRVSDTTSRYTRPGRWPAA